MSASWTDGYITEVEYTASFFRELSPTVLGLAATIQGIESPPVDRPFTYLELGCGHGVSTSVLAAANPNGRFYANDFNPTHVLNARTLAAEGGLRNVTFLEESFAELSLIDLPEFDYIGLHGVLSWINADNRALIADLIRRFLKPGGFVYASYNTQPGWATGAPIQRLFELYSASLSGTVIERIDQCMALADRLIAGKARYFAMNPAAAAWVENMRKQDRRYLAHEYLCGTWTAFYTPDLHALMDAAKLSHVGSANIIENYDDAGLNPDVSALLKSVTDRGHREFLGDNALNRRFRRDIFARGTIRLPQAVQNRRLLEVPFALMRPRAACEAEVTVPGAGSIKLDTPVFTPMLDRLAEGPKTVSELGQVPELGRLGVTMLLRALLTLTSIAYVQVCRPRVAGAIDIAASERFNEAVIRRALSFQGPSCFASPVLGSGLIIDPLDAIFIHAVRQRTDPVALVVQRLAATRQTYRKDGAAITDEAQLRAEIGTGWSQFAARMPAFLAGLGIATDLETSAPPRAVSTA